MPTVSFDVKINGVSTEIRNLGELQETLKGIKIDSKNIDFGTESLDQFVKAQAQLNAEQRKFRDEVKKQERSIIAQEKSYKGLSAQLILARKRAKDLAVQFGKNSDEFKAAAKDVNELDKELKEIDASVGQFQRNVGNYPQAFRAAFGDVTKNILPDFGAKLTGQLESIGLGSDLASSLVNPVTIGLVAAGIAAQETIEYIADVTLEYERLFSEVSKTAGLVGEDLVRSTARLNTISQTFGQDFGRVLQSANNATQGFGRDFNDVLDNIELGLLNIASGDAQDEFLDSFREYPQLIDSAGFSLEEFTRLAVASSKNGVFSDKLIDSIKEADLSLKEFTKTQSDALGSVLGPDVTRDLERRISSGQTTTRDAILEIGNALEASGADFQDYAVITADVFKGAGEDVGGFQDILEIVRESTEALSVPTDAYTARLIEQRDATAQLELEQARLAATFAGSGTSIDILTTKLKAFGTTLLNDVIETFRVNSRILSEDGFFGALRGGAKRFQEVSDQIAQEDADALAEVEQGRKQADETERTRQDAELKAKQQQAQQLKEINDRIREEAKKAEAAAKFALENPEGSINLLSFKLKELKKDLGSATTDGQRSALRAEIDQLTQSIARLKAGIDLDEDRTVRTFQTLETLDTPTSVTSENESIDPRIGLEENANEQILQSRIELNDKIEAEQQEQDARREEQSILLAQRIAQINIESFEDAKQATFDILFDEISTTLQARAIEAFATSASKIPFPFGAIAGGLAAAAIRGLLGQVRSALRGEDGFQLDSVGNAIGPRHSQGGIWSMINGRLANIEGGENVQMGEDGVVSVINRDRSKMFGGLLSAIKNKVFPGKNELLAAINGGFNTPQDVRMPFSFAQTGAQFSPVGAPASFTDKLELSDESIDRITTAVRIGAQQGSEEGTNKGVQEATEQTRRLADLQNLTTF